MRNTLSKHTGFGGFGGKVFDPWARKPRITRAQPRRDDDLDEHGKPKKKHEPANLTAEQAQALYLESQEKLDEANQNAQLATYIAAENAWKLEQAQLANRTEDEKKFDEAVAAALPDKIAAAVAEATTPLHEKIEKMQLENVDSAISLALSNAKIDPKSVASVIAKLDKPSFLNEDGTVKAEDVKALVTGFSAPGDTRPPRTGGLAATNDRGFGQYASKNKT
ncbi:scaffolding protein [Rhodococcus phage ChewyVIII]|uniref:Scaffolding protein n=1 Tax=Rhodococcus phage ChewyVIII TaxID=1887657 RepID=A0A1C9EI27_9CAUD|nr:scaffolding protein [Rhodococcus phage ChewyVIII]AON97463.1 scaffolding protein [Rhodococcus phage ChewyVIII]